MRSLPAALLFLSTIAVSAPAAAKCMSPSAVLIPSSGKVPVGAKLRLLLPAWAGKNKSPTLVVRAASKTIPVVTTRLDTAPGNLDAYLVQVGTSGAGPMTVELQGKSGAVDASWSLEVDAGWKAPVLAKVTPTLARISTSWTCSHELSRQLTFAGVAEGYRVVTAATKADLADPKKTTSVYLPSAPGAFFGRSLSPITTADLRLGFLNCFGETFQFSTTPVWGEIRALLPDGSEPVVSAAPVQIAAP